MTAPVLDHPAGGPAAEPAALEAFGRLAAHLAGTAHGAVSLLTDGCDHAAGAVHATVPVPTPDGTVAGRLCAYDDRPVSLRDGHLDLLTDLAAAAGPLLEARRLVAALGRLASQDPVTGLPNRRGIENAVGAAIARAERGLGTPSAVIVEVDLGHTAGQEELLDVARRLTLTARTVDTVARLGGDQFLVLLESTGGPGAVAALGRLRASLEGVAALGMATYRPGDGVASLLARADAEMYAEKARRAVG